MVICHRLDSINWLVDWIHSFHMPLFVFISGYFYKQKTIYESIKKGITRLLLPFLVIYVLFIVLSPTMREYNINALLYSNPPLWVIWFLPSLFVVQIIANICIRNRYSQWIVFALSPISFLLFDVVNLPFYIWQGLFMYPFYLVGHIVAKNKWIDSMKDKRFSLPLLVICLFVWVISLALQHKTLRLVVCQTNWYLFGDVLCSFAACVVLFFLSRQIMQYKITEHIACLFTWIGASSMTILCLHASDHLLWMKSYPWIGAYWNYTSVLGEYAWSVGYLLVELPTLLFGAFLISRIPFLRNVFA